MEVVRDPVVGAPCKPGRASATSEGQPRYVAPRRRWVVERTLGPEGTPLGRYRRSGTLWVKDYEYLSATAEALIYAAMGQLLVRRLARQGQPRRERARRPLQLKLPFYEPF